MATVDHRRGRIPVERSQIGPHLGDRGRGLGGQWWSHPELTDRP